MKLQQLIEKLGVEGYGRYWLLLELLCDKYEGESLTINLHFNEISAKIQINWEKKLENFLGILSEISLISWEKDGKIFKIEAPILWELKQKDFKRARHESETKATRPPLREKRKEKREKREDVEEEHPQKPLALKITENHVLKSWEKLGNYTKGFHLTRKQVHKLIDLNSVLTVEMYDQAIDRLKLDPFFNNAENKSVDMILSEEVLLRTFQKENQVDLRGRLEHDED